MGVGSASLLGAGTPWVASIALGAAVVVWAPLATKTRSPAVVEATILVFVWSRVQWTLPVSCLLGAIAGCVAWGVTDGAV